MEPLSVFARRESREDLALGAGGSLLVHVLLVAAALILPALSPKTSVKLPYYSVNLVSPEDLGGAPAAAKSASARTAPAAPAAPPKNLSSFS